MASSSQLKVELNEDLIQLYESKTLADFAFIVSDGIELFAHRQILAARSKVFLRMLSTANSSEVLTGRCQVPDVDGFTMNLLLRYLYGSFVVGPDFTVDKAQKLLVIADKYEVMGLVAVCAASLQGRLAIENAADNLILGERHICADLKAAALDYVARNRREFFAAGYLESLRMYSPDLVQEVLRGVPNEGENPVFNVVVDPEPLEIPAAAVPSGIRFVVPAQPAPAAPVQQQGRGMYASARRAGVRVRASRSWRGSPY